MIRIVQTRVTGFKQAIRGMRNPMNSWDNSDSTLCYKCASGECETCIENNVKKCAEFCGPGWFVVGDEDFKLMKKLARAGSEHAKYRRMIVVYTDITAPLYWWKEFDTYKVGTVANSCSTMHSIHKKAITIDDFSYEHLYYDNKSTDNDLDSSKLYSEHILSLIINALNKSREAYLATNDKKYWWQMIQLLPSSYNQRRTVMMNYDVLSNIYHQRKNHKLDEWIELCRWVESLPCSEIITCDSKGE